MTNSRERERKREVGRMNRKYKTKKKKNEGRAIAMKQFLKIYSEKRL